MFTVIFCFVFLLLPLLFSPLPSLSFSLSLSLMRGCRLRPERFEVDGTSVADAALEVRVTGTSRSSTEV